MRDGIAAAAGCDACAGGACRSARRYPAGPESKLPLLLGYLDLPLDFVPDFLPLIGYADDVIIMALVLRSVIRTAGPGSLRRHWPGTPAGLAVIERLAGLPAPTTGNAGKEKTDAA